MFECLLIDLDDTILDFQKQEQVAIRRTLSDAGIEPMQEICALYSRINDASWKRLEKGEITRDEVLRGRFRELFVQLGVEADHTAPALAYMENLATGHYFLPGAREAVESLHRKYRLFLASNGTASVQRRRIESAGLAPYFEEIFISQDVGINKPAKGYFDYCFAHIKGFDPARTLMVGDSLSSDIAGGQNAGIATCWINPSGKVCGLKQKPDYEIQALSQLEGLLQSL
jgi:2-haloacid dehalogenase